MDSCAQCLILWHPFRVLAMRIAITMPAALLQGPVFPVYAGGGGSCAAADHHIVSPKPIQQGLGIKRIIFKHQQDENSWFRGAISSKPSGAYEGIADFFLEHRDQVIFVPTDADIVNGGQGVTVSYDLAGNWCWGNVPTDFARANISHEGTRDVISYYSNSGNQYENTLVTVVFSNSPD